LQLLPQFSISRAVFALQVIQNGTATFLPHMLKAADSTAINFTLPQPRFCANTTPADSSLTATPPLTPMINATKTISKMLPSTFFWSM